MKKHSRALSKYEQSLLTGWEDVHKRSQLTLWLLLSLKEGNKHVAQMMQFIRTATDETIVADQQSMYRALRRLSDADIVSFEQQPSNKGPDLKVYHLTVTGKQLLDAFARRNIINVFYNPGVKALITR